MIEFILPLDDKKTHHYLELCESLKTSETLNVCTLYRILWLLQLSLGSKYPRFVQMKWILFCKTYQLQVRES